MARARPVARPPLRPWFRGRISNFVPVRLWFRCRISICARGWASHGCIWPRTTFFRQQIPFSPGRCHFLSAADAICFRQQIQFSSTLDTTFVGSRSHLLLQQILSSSTAVTTCSAADATFFGSRMPLSSTAEYHFVAAECNHLQQHNAACFGSRMPPSSTTAYHLFDSRIPFNSRCHLLRQQTPRASAAERNTTLLQQNATIFDSTVPPALAAECHLLRQQHTISSTAEYPLAADATFFDSRHHVLQQQIPPVSTVDTTCSDS